MTSIHEFLEKNIKNLENGIATEEQIKEMTSELIEMSKSEERAFKSDLVKLMLHMLKYRYQPDHQTSSWIFTIRDQNSNVETFIDDKSLLNKIKPNITKYYNLAINGAMSETGLPKSMFPSSLPTDWSIENLGDENFIEAFLKANAFSADAKKFLGL